MEPAITLENLAERVTKLEEHTLNSTDIWKRVFYIFGHVLLAHVALIVAFAMVAFVVTALFA